MIAAVLDTHTVIWLLYADTRLSSSALRAIEAASAQQSQVAISSTSLVEAAYLEEKGTHSRRHSSWFAGTA
jgi:PIN domain nuclease of toxin-antitoxin system